MSIALPTELQWPRCIHCKQISNLAAHYRPVLVDIRASEVLCSLFTHHEGDVRLDDDDGRRVLGRLAEDPVKVAVDVDFLREDLNFKI